MTCFLYDKCNHKDCDKPFCLRKYKLDCLYNEALLSMSQRKHITLKVDGTAKDITFNEDGRLVIGELRAAREAVENEEGEVVTPAVSATCSFPLEYLSRAYKND